MYPADSSLKINHDVRRTVLATIYAAACLFVNCIGNAISDRLNSNNFVDGENKKALPDLLLQVTAPLYKAGGVSRYLPDHLIALSIVLIFVRVATMGSAVMIVQRRLLFVGGTVFLLRAVSVTITVLPNPLLECVSVTSESIIYDAFLICTGRKTTCGDVFFSGHTIIFTLLSAVWMTYCSDVILKSIVNMTVLISLITLVASSFHYTIDVLFGYLITISIWNVYHWAVLIPAFKKFWWARFIRVVDGATDGVHSRK